jgi:hypothetical protein
MADPKAIAHTWRTSEDHQHNWKCSYCGMIVENDGTGPPGGYYKYTFFNPYPQIQEYDCLGFFTWKMYNQ